MSAAMCICFIGAWTPYAIVSLMYIQNKYVPHVLVVAAPMCAKSNTFLHPVIYYLAVKRFRDEVRQLLKRFHILHSDASTNDNFEITTCNTKMPCTTATLLNKDTGNDMKLNVRQKEPEHDDDHKEKECLLEADDLPAQNHG